MMLRSTRVTAFVVGCLLAIGGAAQAQPGKPQAVRLDGPLVQISCVPELRFVSVLTKVDANGEVIGQTSAGAELQRLRRLHNIWDVSYLRDHPLTCRLPGTMLSSGATAPGGDVVVSVSKYDEGGGNGQCEAGIKYKLMISVDKKHRYEISPLWLCSSSDHLVQLMGSRLSDCVISVDGPPSGSDKLGCAESSIDDMPRGVSTKLSSR
jgi:hypothetical protein